MHNYISALKNAYLIFGALVGVLIALPIERYLVKFNEGGKWYTQVFKSAIGIALTLGLLEGLKIPLNAILPEYTIARALRYSLVVIFVIAVYPISFKWFARLETKIERKRLRKRLTKKTLKKAPYQENSLLNKRRQQATALHIQNHLSVFDREVIFYGCALR